MVRKSVVLLSLIGIGLTAIGAAAGPFTVKVNFQTQAAQVPEGYLRDYGQAFGDQGNGFSYGWSRDITADSRERNTNPDKRWDTLVHLQKGTAAVWEIVIPNGIYNLVIGCGDPGYTDQTNSFDVEGVIIPDPNGQTGNYDKLTAQVIVADGRLTLQPALNATPAASNSKICFVDIVMAVSPAIARDPKPADTAIDVPRDAALAWSAGDFAATHDVYLGTDFTDVNDAGIASAVSQGQAETAYEPAGVLTYGQTYYWRIDEVNAAPDSTVFKGKTWSFTVEPYAYPIENVTATASSAQADMGPEKTVDGSGLNEDDQHSTESKDMWLSAGAQPNWIQFEFDKVYKLHELWVWNSNQLIETFIGFGAKDVTVEYSADGATWATLDGVPVFAKATASPTYVYNTVVPFGGALAKYVKLTINASWGGLPSTGLSEVRFFYIPAQARQPEPAADGTGVAIDAALNWRPGREAGSHTVYFGTDAEAVANGTAPSETVTDHGFMPASMEFGTTYFWKVDEVNEAMEPSVYEGSVWSFATQEYAPIDNMESYNDDDNRIFDTWVDGWVNNTGSQVGYDVSPFAEGSIVHGGAQSMPFHYDNSESPFYSEAEREFATTQNWTVSGADTLVVNVQGRAPGFVERADGTILMGGGGADIWGTADQFRFAAKRLNGNGAIIAKVESLTRADAWTKVGVMIRENLDPGSRFAAVYATPDYGVRYQARVNNAGDATSDSSVVTTDQTAQTAPVWIKIERTGNDFKGYYSADGKTWTAMVWNPQTITMGANAYVGLAVTSHNASVAASAQFSNVTMTGATGAWEVAEIGVAQASNAPETLYVTVTDSAGKAKTVTHPDPAITVTTTWQSWQIPLSEFTSAGVNMTRVKKMTIGVGNKSAPTAGGAGILYIDDIGYGRPIATP